MELRVVKSSSSLIRNFVAHENEVQVTKMTLFSRLNSKSRNGEEEDFYFFRKIFTCSHTCDSLLLSFFAVRSFPTFGAGIETIRKLERDSMKRVVEMRMLSSSNEKDISFYNEIKHA